MTPADGRLRGQDFAARVTSVAWPDQAVVRGRTVDAVTGHRFVTFTLQLAEDTAAISPHGTDPPLTAAFDWRGGSQALSLVQINDALGQQVDGSTWPTASQGYVASVPARSHSVALVLSQGSFSQTLNLWTLERVPPSPTVLYRDPERPSVTATTSATGTLMLSNPADGFSDSAAVSLQSATLSYFPPIGDSAAPSSPSQAVLSVLLDAEYPNDPNDQTTSGHYLGAQSPLPGSLLTFTPTGESPIAATVSDPGDTTGKGNADDGIFDATYSFVVPGDLTSGTVTVGAGAFTGTEFTLFTAESGNSTLDIASPLGLSLSFPPVPAPATQRTPPWVGAPLPPTVSAASSTSGSVVSGSGTKGFPIWPAVLLPVLLAVAIGLFERWRRHRPDLAPSGSNSRATAAAAGPDTAPDTSPDASAPVVTPVLADSAIPARPPGTALADAAATPIDESPMVLVLGPPGARGLRHEPDRRIVIEILAWMVFHNDHAHSADEILVGVYPTEGTRREVNRETFFTYLSKVRQCVGPEHLPDATSAGGYRLLDVTSDWERFEALNRRADATLGPESLELRTEALALVRGAPFQGVPRGHYQWAFDEHLDSLMTSRIVTSVLRLAGDLFALGDYGAVDEAVQAGLRADATDPDLLELQARVAAARKDGLVHPGRELGDDETGTLGTDPTA